VSVKVLSEALDHSRSKGSDRCVLLALADAASHDGVTWLPIMPARGRGGERRNLDERKCITHRAHCSKSEAIRSIKELEELGEIEIRQAQRGQKRINVYRLTVGSIADSDVDYDRLPFELSAPFGANLRGANLTPRTGDSESSELAPGEVSSEPLRGASLAPHGVPVPRARVTTPEPSLDPSAAEPEDQPSDGEPGLVDPAAAEPVRDEEVRELVERLPGVDPGSVKQILPLAHGLDVGAFRSVEATLSLRLAAGSVRNACGLLVHLLQIARAERAALFSAQLAASLGQRTRGYTPAPWTIDAIKRDEPERYVRLLARSLWTEEHLREALHGHPADVVDRCIELYAKVRAGDEPVEQLGSPEQERERWVRLHANTLPAGDVEHVIATWADVDDVERDALRQVADEIRAAGEERRAA
jgi:hypothetical protein